MSIHERMRESSHFKWYTSMPPQVGMVTMVTIFHSTPKNDQNCWLSLKYSHSQPKKKNIQPLKDSTHPVCWGWLALFRPSITKTWWVTSRNLRCDGTSTRPKLGSTSPANIFRSRDFPEPARPVSATNLPWETVNYSVCGCYMVCYA